MRGTVSAGMALALHERGLVTAFDAVYGASAGAISGAWLLSANPEGLRGWTDPDYARSLIRWSALLHRRPRRRPVVDVETLVEVVYQTEFPMDFESILASPVEYHPLATDAATGQSTDLRPLITDAAELRLALRASASLPFLAGPPIELHGRRFYDAGVAESIPFRTPLEQGATHVLVLRSRRPLDVADLADPAGPAQAAAAANAADQAEIDDETAVIEETEADIQAEADRLRETEIGTETAGDQADDDQPPGQEQAAPRTPRPPRSVRLLTRTTLRNESPELRRAMLTRAARNLADAERIAERQAAGRAFAVFPPPWTPGVSRLTTDGALLTAALVSGREAVNVLFDESDESDERDEPDELPH